MLLQIRNNQPEACESTAIFGMAANRIRSVRSRQIHPKSRSHRWSYGSPTRTSLGKHWLRKPGFIDKPSAIRLDTDQADDRKARSK